MRRSFRGCISSGCHVYPWETTCVSELADHNFFVKEGVTWSIHDCNDITWRGGWKTMPCTLRQEVSRWSVLKHTSFQKITYLIIYSCRRRMLDIFMTKAGRCFYTPWINMQHYAWRRAFLRVYLSSPVSDGVFVLNIHGGQNSHVRRHSIPLSVQVTSLSDLLAETSPSCVILGEICRKWQISRGYRCGKWRGFHFNTENNPFV